MPTAAQELLETELTRINQEGQAQLRAEASSDEITRSLIKVETTNFYK